MKKIYLILAILLLSACKAKQTTDTGQVIDSQLDPNLYTLTISLEEEVEGYSEQQSRIIYYDNYARGVSWSEGKGLVRGELQYVDPAVDWISVEDTIIVKTTDRKITSLLPGDIVTMACLADYEPVCPRTGRKGVGECKEIWEFDFCRMLSVKEGNK